MAKDKKDPQEESRALKALENMGMVSTAVQQVTHTSQKALEDLYFGAAGAGTDALEGFLTEADRKVIINNETPFAIHSITFIKDHKAPFGTIDAWNIGVLVDAYDRGEPKKRTLSLADNKYRHGFFSALQSALVENGQSPIGPWGLRFYQNSAEQDVYDMKPYHLLHDDEEVIQG